MRAGQSTVRSFPFRLAVAVSLTLILPACGGKGGGTAGGTGSVSFSAVWETPPAGAARVLGFPGGGAKGPGGRALAPVGDACTDYGINWVYMEVWSKNTKIAGERFECQRHEGTLVSVPAGENLQLVLYATVSGYTDAFWRAQDCVVFRLSPGESKRFDNVVMRYIGPDGTPPSVVAFSPDADANGLPVTTTVRFKMSEPMVERTMSDNSAVVLEDRNGARIPGSMYYDNTNFSAMFRPARRLAAGVSHTVTLTSAMTDKAGRGLSPPVSWNFTTSGGGGWREPTLIETDNASASYVSVATDGNGNAVAVWQEYSGTYNRPFANVYTPSGGWGTATPIGNDNAALMTPKVAMDGSGNAIAVWVETSSTATWPWKRTAYLMMNRYTWAGGWGTPTVISTKYDGNVEFFQLAMNPGGSAIAVWQQSDGSSSPGSNFTIMANRYTPAGGWGTAAPVATDNAGGKYPRVAIDSGGNAVAVWAEGSGGLMANRYTPAGGWGTPMAVGNGGLWPDVAMDPEGNAVAVWQQSDGTRYNILANRYTPAGGWGTATLIETDDANDAERPRVAMDPGGNAVAVWEQGGGYRYYIKANRFTPAGGWGVATFVEQNGSFGGASYPVVGIDGSGNAVAVWTQWTGYQYSIVWNRFTPAGGWGSAAPLEADNSGDAFYVAVAADVSGNVFAVWDHADRKSIHHVVARRYLAPGWWGSVSSIDIGELGDSDSPDVATDGNGNAVAVWRQWDGARYKVIANRYTVSGGWEGGRAVALGMTSAQNPRVAMDALGNAVVVWEQSDGYLFHIMANRYTPLGGWGIPTLLETDIKAAESPRVAMDGRGNAVALWAQHDGTGYYVMASRYTPAGGWGIATPVDNAYAAGSTSHQLAMDGSGSAIAVWVRPVQPDTYQVMASRCAPTGAWGGATRIDNGALVLGADPQLAMDGSGNAVAVWWGQSAGGVWPAVARWFTPSGGWGAETRVAPTVWQDQFYPGVAVDGNGNAVVAWMQYDYNLNRFYVTASRYTPAGGWGPPSTLEPVGSLDGWNHRVAMDGSGNAVVVWESWNGGTYAHVTANRCTPAGLWVGARDLQANEAVGGSGAHLAMDGDGNPLVVWTEVGGTRSAIGLVRTY